jgi:hypothetical protein
MRYAHGLIIGAAVAMTVAGAGVARAVDYTCIPLEVATLDNRVHVECAEPAPKTRGSYPTDTGHSIRYFALSLSANQDWLNRFVQMSTIAINSGSPIQFSFDSGDYSGETFGCARTDCRKPWAFKLLKDARVP